ncbi:DUF2642 domain-containing protein [Aquibacillus rhizosphaerae]|uniref:DUF2642 domain-containing protein n=1 Tax=Aquibacillus rhizosphaerae TaxID=3051431 RepID=A0ABT7L1N3_9BACI|nr:DUF2642 domain-containing protein [Aquibacillus sp. LR5S19]MDL4839756.1 DUF2642 domain-containing protein [Aquibacillus sp. LR5S19]
MALTNRQTRLLELLNQMTQNLTTNNGLNTDVSLDLPGLDLDANLNVGEGETSTPSPVIPTPTTPTTLREVLLSLVNEQVQITTPFGTITGTLLLVRNDYIAIIENTGDQTLVRMDKIEFVSEL